MAEIALGIASLVVGVIALTNSVEPTKQLVHWTIENATGRINDKMQDELGKEFEMCALRFRAIEEYIQFRYGVNDSDGFILALSNDILMSLRRSFQDILLTTKDDLKKENQKVRIRKIVPGRKYEYISTNRLKSMMSEMRRWHQEALVAQLQLLFDDKAAESLRPLQPHSVFAKDIQAMLEVKRQAKETREGWSSRQYDGITLSLPVEYHNWLPGSTIRYKEMENTNILGLVVRRTEVSDEELEKMTKIAHTLALVDPRTMGLPRCTGIADLDDEDQSYELKLEVDISHMKYKGNDVKLSPTSLRALLSEEEVDNVDLNTRHALAKNLASSVFYLHTAEVLHKNLRPENIMIVQNNHIYSTWQPYLLGFDDSRGTDQGSNRIISKPGKGEDHHDLYRFEDRRSSGDTIALSTMRHDMYSLGVILMEIGLWAPLKIWKKTPVSGREPVLNNGYLDDLSFDRREEATSQEWRNMGENRVYSFYGIYGLKPAELQQGFVNLVDREMPQTMGKKYTSIVRKCLECFSNVELVGGRHSKGRLLAEEVLSDLQSISL